MTTKIDKAIELNKLHGAKVLLNEYFTKQDKQEWLDGMRVEYELSYPTQREMINSEKIEFNTLYDGTIIARYSDFVYPLVDIDYSDDLDYISFEDWLNETKVISEAVLDEDGNIIEPEVTELIRIYMPPDTESRIVSYIREKTLPSVLTMRQARLALLQAGLLATVEDAIMNGTDEAMKIEWEYATEVRRDWTSLIALTEALGMTSDELDNLFILGGSL